MKKIFFYIIAYFSIIKSSIANDAWILGIGDNGVTAQQLKEWDAITFDHIPKMIRSVIDFLLWVSWTIAIIFIIYWAYQLLLWPVTSNERTKWKNTIITAITWLAIAILAWAIIRLIIENLGVLGNTTTSSNSDDSPSNTNPSSPEAYINFLAKLLI
jgi:hypothetical protein